MWGHNGEVTCIMLCGLTAWLHFTNLDKRLQSFQKMYNYLSMCMFTSSSHCIVHVHLAMVGWRQRVEYAREVAASSSAADGVAPPSGPFQMVPLLSYFWAWGHMSPQTLQKICAAVQKDLESMSGQDLADMAKGLEAEIASVADLGAQGRHSGNCNRDMMRFLGRPWVTTSTFDMPLRKMGSAVGAMGAAVAQCMLLPHVMFAAVGNHFPNAFRKLICPSRERLVEFWSSVADSPQLKGQGYRTEGVVCFSIETHMKGSYTWQGYVCTQRLATFDTHTHPNLVNTHLCAYVCHANVKL